MVNHHFSPPIWDGYCFLLLPFASKHGYLRWMPKSSGGSISPPSIMIFPKGNLTPLGWAPAKPLRYCGEHRESHVRETCSNMDSFPRRMGDFFATVDGSEIRDVHQLIDSLSYHLWVFGNFRWLAGFLPSTVPMNSEIVMYTPLVNKHSTWQRTKTLHLLRPRNFRFGELVGRPCPDSSIQIFPTKIHKNCYITYMHLENSTKCRYRSPVSSGLQQLSKIFKNHRGFRTSGCPWDQPSDSLKS